MDTIRFAENVLLLRKTKGITQEQLADFCGVTKASVSKWEKRQSIPDMTLVPRIAAFFGVSIDELLGYEAYLSKEQIHKVYEDLSEQFAKEDFEVVFERSKDYVKQYYSCYELLEYIVLLWLNHYVLAKKERVIEILKEAKELCERILSNSRDIRLCNDTTTLKAIVDLQLGDTQAAIEALEEISDPIRISVHNGEILIGAYIQAGMTEKADDFVQIMMYQSMITLVNMARSFIGIHKDNLEKCEETLHRIEELSKLYNLEAINFNMVATFYYQMAIIYCSHNKKKQTIQCLRKFSELTISFLHGKHNHLEADDYFDKLEQWFDKDMLAGKLPRDKKVIADSLCQAFDIPVFEVLKEDKDFILLKKQVAMRVLERVKD